MALYSTSTVASPRLKTFLVALVIVTSIPLVFFCCRRLSTTVGTGRSTYLSQPVLVENLVPISTGTREQSVKVQRCTVDQDVKVLGRVLDRCATEEAAKLAVEEDIYVSVKTTRRYHNSRVLPSLQTWFQAVPADRIHVVTDGGANNDALYQAARKIGIDIVTTGCSPVYAREALCCKSRNEYFRYFNTTTKTGDLHKWYCHFDDDMYVNIPALVKGLREALNKSADGGVYYGRWPKENMPTMPDGMPVSEKTLKVLGFELDRHLTVQWATGAAYCVSRPIMKKVKELLTKNTYETYCARFALNDDTVAAILIGMAGYYITNTENIRTQYDGSRRKPSVGYKDTITIATRTYPSSLNDDPSRFLAYHCLLYPSTSWCQK